MVETNSNARRADASGRGRRGRGKHPRIKRFFQVTTILVLVLALAGTVAGYAFYKRTELPDPNADFGTQTTRLFFRDGTTELGSLAVQNRTVVSYDQMAESIKYAAVAAEDRSFWTNQGIDFKGLARAVFGIATNQEITGGGSTITQQYIKIRYLTSEQTFSRKFTELALAIKMDKELPKEKVLEDYLNTIYFGRGAYGIEAAAQTYFGVSAAQLSLHQSAALAALINQPSAFDPANGEKAIAGLTERVDYVLDGMVLAKNISQSEADQLRGTLPQFPQVQTSEAYGGSNGFLMSMATSELEANGFTADQINGGGYKIITTFDAAMQAAAVDSVQKNTKKAAENARRYRDEAGNWVEPTAEGLKTGLASVEVGTGGVLALYGGPDFIKSSLNWATTNHYAASTFKVWGIVAGLRNGFGLTSVLRGSTFTPPGESVPVHNDSGANYGQTTLLKATQYSMNTAFVDLMTRIDNGSEQLVDAATDGGLVEDPSWREQGDRMVLGEGEVTVLDQANAFATLANKGKRNEAHVVAQVIDTKGTVVYEGSTSGEQTIEADVAADVTYALSQSAEPSQRTAVDGRDVAGKTGTEGIAVGQGGSARQLTRAGWLCGYTAKISTAVMMAAGETGQENLDVYAKSGQAAFYGAGYPTDIWNDYMAVATQKTDRTEFPPAANIQPTVANPPSQAPSPSVTQETPQPTETATAAPEPTETVTMAPEPTELPSETATTVPSVEYPQPSVSAGEPAGPRTAG